MKSFECSGFSSYKCNWKYKIASNNTFITCINSLSSFPHHCQTIICKKYAKKSLNRIKHMCIQFYHKIFIDCLHEQKNAVAWNHNYIVFLWLLWFPCISCQFMFFVFFVYRLCWKYFVQNAFTDIQFPFNKVDYKTIKMWTLVWAIIGWFFGLCHL